MHFYLHFYRHDEAHDASTFKTRVASINRRLLSYILRLMVRTMVGIGFSIITTTWSLKFTRICEICTRQFFFVVVFFFISQSVILIGNRSSYRFHFEAVLCEARCAKCQITFSMCWKILCLNRHHWRRISGSWCDFLLTIQCTKIRQVCFLFFHLFLLFRPYTRTANCRCLPFFLLFFYLFVSCFLLMFLFVSSILQFIKCKKRRFQVTKTLEVRHVVIMRFTSHSPYN